MTCKHTHSRLTTRLAGLPTTVIDRAKTILERGEIDNRDKGSVTGRLWLPAGAKLVDMGVS